MGAGSASKQTEEAKFAGTYSNRVKSQQNVNVAGNCQTGYEFQLMFLRFVWAVVALAAQTIMDRLGGIWGLKEAFGRHSVFKRDSGKPQIVQIDFPRFL